MFSRQHHEDPMMGQLRAEIASLDARLAADVTGLDDGNDPVCRQALSDAGERMQSAGGMKATAATVGELRIVRRTLIEGLTSTRWVRERRGMPLGPELPPMEDPTPATPVPAYGNQGMGGMGGLGAGGPMPFWKKAMAIGGAVAGGEMLGGMLGGGGGGFGDDDDGGGWGGDGGGDWGGDG